MGGSLTLKCFQNFFFNGPKFHLNTFGGSEAIKTFGSEGGEGGGVYTPTFIRSKG